MPWRLSRQICLSHSSFSRFPSPACLRKCLDDALGGSKLLCQCQRAGCSFIVNWGCPVPSPARRTWDEAWISSTRIIVRYLEDAPQCRPIAALPMEYLDGLEFETAQPSKPLGITVSPTSERSRAGKLDGLDGTEPGARVPIEYPTRLGLGGRCWMLTV